MVELVERVEILEHHKQQVAKDSWLDDNGPTLGLASTCLVIPILFMERHRLPELIKNLMENLPISR